MSVKAVLGGVTLKSYLPSVPLFHRHTFHTRNKIMVMYQVKHVIEANCIFLLKTIF